MARRPRVLSERGGRFLLNLYPPFLFNRIRIVSIGPGYRSCRVRVKRSPWTRNLNGTTFGGAIFSAADPFYAILYWQAMARRGASVQTWLRRATADFRKPARTDLTLDFRLDERDLTDALEALGRDGRFRRTFPVDAVDLEGEVCAHIETEVYLRRPRGEQREVSAF